MKLQRTIPLLCLLLATSCSSTDGPQEKDIMLSDVVTLVSSTTESGTTFTFQRYDDSPEITLTAPDYTTTKIEAGQRALLYYYPESGEAYTSGNIKVRSLQSINDDNIRIASIDTYTWDATPVWLTSIWRSGQYINMRLRMSYSSQKRQFCLVADETTIHNDVVDLYLVHDLEGEPESYLMEVIASFDISEIWDSNSCSGINVHINDTNLNQSLYLFTKSE